ncbi:hypothetical protein E2L08_10625 [Palleronia sediminis]|uniref:L,D-TPase catalytic domain-containing protein n=1 Tax=Palleronia sediminis TaxID=2547833 RepID=A0A4R6A822_9RHOB|nr:L,D-transpeptidase family protein [Palleronia sediminis]TDL78388.1 hypothetical protein E2L08_10625 [Palleronia sediminis]
MRLTTRGLFAHGRNLPCTIGRGGITADKREGDGATPAGHHRIAGMFHRADRLRAPAPWSRPIGPRDLWSDDPRATDYNSAVRAPYGFSAERLWRADPVYDVVIVLDWNLAAPVAGRGSAIFLHAWRRRGAATEGCIALSRGDLLWLATRVQPGDVLRVDQLAGRSPKMAEPTRT